MLTPVFLCHAPEDAQLACELAGFLQRGARVGVEVEAGRIGSGETLLTKVAAGHSDPVVIALLSPDSAPAAWRREDWMPAFEPEDPEVCVIPVLARECYLPALLRQKTIDLTAGRLAGLRRLKALLLKHWDEPALAGVPGFTGLDGELECLRRKLGDAPGALALTGPAGAGKTALALEFCDRFGEDFEALFWLDGGERSLAGLAGDLAEKLGFRLKGDVETNLGKLRAVCAARRFLVVIDDASGPDALKFWPGGFTSLLITTRRGDLDIEVMALAGGFPAPEKHVRGGLAAAESALARSLESGQWDEAREIGRAAFRSARDLGRIAEAFEFMSRLFEESAARGDRQMAGECAAELTWIQEGWGNEAEADRLRRYLRFHCQDQLWLPGIEGA